MRVMTLAACCQIVSGATPKTSVPEYWDGDVEWATPADLSKLDSAFIEETPRKITSEGLASCAAAILPVGSVLLSSRAPIGHVAINTRPMATNQGFKSLIPKPEVLDAKYLFHWLRANKDHLQALGNGATFKEISKATVARVELPVPPLDEQRRIAAILDQADALRAQRRRAPVLLDVLAQSIFLEMFSAPELPVRQLRELVDPDDRINYGVVQPGEHHEEGVPLIRVSNLRNGAVDRSGLKLISPTIEAKYARSRIRGNEVLLSCVGSTGVVALASREDIGSNVARAVTRIPISEPDMRIYVAGVLSSPRVQRYFENELRTVSQPTLNGKQIGETLVPIPSAAAVTEFAQRVRSLGPVRKSYLSHLDYLDNLFASLEAQAFSGKL